MKKTIGYRIRKLRESKDYSQENMAGELGITGGAYAKIERGETDPSATRLIQIAEILEVNVTMFFEDSILAPVKTGQSGKFTETVSRKDIEMINQSISKLNKEIEKLKSELGISKRLGKKSKG